MPLALRKKKGEEGGGSMEPDMSMMAGKGGGRRGRKGKKAGISAMLLGVNTMYDTSSSDQDDDDDE